MAVVEINETKVLRFDDGGVLTITPDGSADDYKVMRIEPGSGITLVPGVRATMPHDIDRGVLDPNTREGDEQPSTMAMNVKLTGGVSATDLYGMLVAEGTDGYLPKFTIVIEWFDSASAATGTRFTMTNAVRASAPQPSQGTEYDTMQCDFTSPEPLAAVTF